MFHGRKPSRFIAQFHNDATMYIVQYIGLGHAHELGKGYPGFAYWLSFHNRLSTPVLGGQHHQENAIGLI
jgi:hypothetical protein